LKNIPSVDNAIVGTEEGNLLILQAQEYDKIINFESSPLFLAIAKQLKSKEKFGFEMNKLGRLTNLTEKSGEFLRLQTDDYFRRRINTKPMQQILLEVAGFPWDEQLYKLVTKEPDDEWARQFLYENNLLKEDHPEIIGLNIGSSLKNSAKRWPIENFYRLAEKFQKDNSDWTFLVLAGPEDKEIYEELIRINSNKPLKNLVFSGHNNSISQFISLVNIVPIVVSADTFGMHTAIALRKNVVSLHGPQSEQEVYLYNKGQKVLLNLECSPCFSPKIEKCINSQRLQCMRKIDINLVEEALKSEINNY
jgi:ADP-heptose:LPS heptosyltransferase